MTEKPVFYEAEVNGDPVRWETDRMAYFPCTRDFLNQFFTTDGRAFRLRLPIKGPFITLDVVWSDFNRYLNFLVSSPTFDRVEEGMIIPQMEETVIVDIVELEEEREK